MPSWFPAALLSLSLLWAGSYVLPVCVPDFILSTSLQCPACSLNFHDSHIPASIYSDWWTHHLTQLILKDRNLVSFFSKSRPEIWTRVAAGTGRTPLMNLNIPTTALTPWSFHFLAQLCVSEAGPEHSQDLLFWLLADSCKQQEILQRVRTELSHPLPSSCGQTLGFAAFMDKALPTVETMSLFSTPSLP